MSVWIEGQITTDDGSYILILFCSTRVRILLLCNIGCPQLRMAADRFYRSSHILQAGVELGLTQTETVSLELGFIKG